LCPVTRMPTTMPMITRPAIATAKAIA